MRALILQELLAPLTPRHRSALLWFADRAGTIQPFTSTIATTDGETYLTSRPKGIYKPEWSSYALSVRQSLKSKYRDQEPIVRPDGTWLYRYFQEQPDPAVRDDQFTNRGLVECWQDNVPVGVMLQASGKPNVRYKILGVALVSNWDGGYFFLEGFAPDGHARPRGPSGELELMLASQLSVAFGAFNPTDVIDGRERTMASIVRRRGQPAFRQALLAAYDNHCAFSDCDAPEALEAAHITPYRGPETDRPDNGLLLRADLHTLFDLGLLAVDPTPLSILISPSLADTKYSELAGRRIRMPKHGSHCPSNTALTMHKQWSGL